MIYDKDGFLQCFTNHMDCYIKSWEEMEELLKLKLG